MAVHALDLSEIVAASSMLFARGWWRVHFTCGSQYILIPTSAFTFAPLVARNGGTPCWIPFSSAVPGFALRNRFRVIRDLRLNVVEAPLCARLPIYFLIQRQRSPDGALCATYGATPCSVSYLLCLWVISQFMVSTTCWACSMSTGMFSMTLRAKLIPILLPPLVSIDTTIFFNRT